MSDLGPIAQTPDAAPNPTLGQRWQEFITNLNYDERAIHALVIGATALTMVALHDKGHTGSYSPYNPHMASNTDPLAFRAMDGAAGALGGEVVALASGERTTDHVGKRLFTSLSTTAGRLILEYGIFGTENPEQLGAFGVGTLARVGLHASAKALYNSGATKPIYRLLGIKDRRVANKA